MHRLDTGAMAVIVAQQFNPSVLNQLWLLRKGLIRDDEQLEGMVFSEVVVQFKADTFQFLLIPPQLQFVPTVDAGAQQNLVQEKLGRIVQELPNTPFRALGFNFNWHIVLDEGEDVGHVTRHFFAQNSPLYEQFATPDAKFGAYLSKDFAGFRLKLDIKPITINGTEDRVLVAFNFHSDVPEVEGAEHILQRIPLWNAARDEATRIINTIQ